MDRTNSQVTERIINLTLEILSLLTGEDYTMVKKQSIPERDSRARREIKVDPEELSIPSMPKKDSEVSSKSSSSPAPEVSLRCEDIAVYLSMEEWEYLEAHREDYERTEDPNTSMGYPGGGKTQSHEILNNPSSENCTNIPKQDISQGGSSPEKQRNLNKDPKLEELNLGRSKRQSLRKKLYLSKQKADIKKRADFSLKRNDFNKGGLNPKNGLDLKSQQGSESDEKTGDFSVSPGDCPKILDPPTDQIQCESKCGQDNQEPESQLAFSRNNGQYVCNFCGKCFQKNSYIIRHVRIHTGEKPFKCNDCEKCFSDKSVLYRHQKIHSRHPRKPFFCKECGEGFSERTSFAEHLKIHPGEKPYLCVGCGRIFKYWKALANHQRLHKHGNLQTVVQ